MNSKMTTNNLKESLQASVHEVLRGYDEAIKKAVARHMEAKHITKERLEKGEVDLLHLRFDDPVDRAFLRETRKDKDECIKAVRRLLSQYRRQNSS
jgi:hypothetical protein